MIKSQVKVGSVYAVKVGERIRPVRIDRSEDRVQRTTGTGMSLSQVRTHWTGTNLDTGRTVSIRSAAKLRWEMVQVDGVWRKVAS